MERRPGRHARLPMILVALGVAALPVTPAAAAAVKPYVAVVSDAPPGAQAPDPAAVSHVPAGTRRTLAVTLLNYNDQQGLGSADVTVPAALALVGASLGTASGATIQLRNLDLPKDASGGSAPPARAFTVTVDAPCEAGGSSATWAVAAKQSNEFNGAPGNALTPATTPPSSLTTQITGSCALRFAAQPAGAVTNQAITSAPYGTPGGQSVAVEVVGGDGSRVTSSSAAITLSRSALSAGAGAVAGATATATAGLATFTALRVDAPGTYALDAAAPGVTGTTSRVFRIAQSVAVCAAGASCTTTASGGARAPTRLSALASATAGETATSFLTASFGFGSTISCPDPRDARLQLTLTPPDHTVIVDITSAQRTKTITLTIDKFWVNLDANNGAAFLPVCFGSPEPFVTAFGTVSSQQGAFDFDADGLAEPQYAGLLPNCDALPAATVQACVSKRNKTGAGAGVITVLLPSLPGDPKMHG